MTNYSFSVTSENEYEDADGFGEMKTDTLVHVGVGSLALVSYAAKEVRDTIDEKATYTVSLAEVDGETGLAVNTVVSLTANGRVVSNVIAGELRTLRKAEKAQAGE